MKLWILLALVTATFGATKEQADDYVFPDYWQNDYEWYSDEAEKLGIISSEKNELDNEKKQEELSENASNERKYQNAVEPAEVVALEVEKQRDLGYDESDSLEKELTKGDNKILQEIDTLRKTIEIEEDKEPFDLFDDYQFEDNRSDPKEQQDMVDDGFAVEQPNAAEGMTDESGDIIKKDNLDDLAVKDEDNEEIFGETRDILNNDTEENLNPIDDTDNNRIFDDFVSDKTNEVVEEPNLDEIDNQEIFDETKHILAEDDETKMLAPAEDTDNQNIFDEIRAILDETDSDENEKSSDSDADNNENIPRDNDQISISKEFRNFDDAKEDETLTNKESKDTEEDLTAKEEEQNVEYNINVDDVKGDDFNESNNFDEQVEEGDENKSEESEIMDNDTNNKPQDDEEDTVNKVIEDLNDDLKQLFETWGKLTSVEDDDDVTNEDDVLKYEDKFGKPFREDFVLSQRDNYNDYENIDDDNIDQLFAKIANGNSDIAVEHDGVPDNVNEPNSENTVKDNDQVFYNNDALDANDSNKESNDDSEAEIQEIDLPAPVNEEVKEHENPEPVNTEKQPTKTIPVEDLTPSQYEDLMKQFAMVHNAELNTDSDDFGRNVVPIPVRLSLDEPKVVESPNFPGFYPTNNIVDWILDGEGMGIELNITEFIVNGAAGDYLLIKPGGVDDTRVDGLVFSYTLNEQRNFRFMDVDRMFVRFVTRPAFVGMRGFQFSAKMVAPVAEEPDLEPAPAPLLPVPAETLTLNLGGLTLADFVIVKEEFRQLIADMATVFINTNTIAMGLNTTEEITQIVSAQLCNVDWPNASFCAEVTFGVPLVYEDDDKPARLSEDDLRAMWYTYIYENPFATRLWKLGITEFSVPNDSTVLMVWLVIAVGVLVSMGLLAFALWRFSCFEDYTRMAAYSDTDSINDKRNLDLYPTPHQTLPPLYADTDYKWDEDVKYDDSTRVDMGGFANRSYVRDELFDIDSDEDIVTAPRDRYTTDV